MLAGLSLIVFTMVFSLPGAVSAYSEKDPMVLKCGIDNPPNDIKARSIKRLGDLVEKRTNGRVTFKYFYGASLIKKPQFVDAVAKGIADISTGPISFITGKIPELSPFEVYGAYDLNKAPQMHNEVRPLLIKLFSGKGVYPLMFQFTGNTIFAHKSKILKKPADWDGAKMRLGGRWQSALGKKWGASPVFLPPPALYLACQRGTIDGYMLIMDIIYGLKLYEVTPKITDTGMSNNIEIVPMNLKKWKALSQQDRDIFKAAVAEVEPWNVEQTLKVNVKIKKDVVSKGGEVYALTDAEKQVYIEEANTLWPEVEKVSGAMGKQFMEVLKKYK